MPAEAMGIDDVSVVVVNYNASHHLAECVRSVRADGVQEVIVADNGSVDGVADAVAGIDPPPVLVGTGGNLGFGAGANRGATVAGGSVLVVMNPDCVVEPGTFKVLLEALDRDPDLAVVGPRVETVDGAHYPSARTFPALVDAMGHAFLGFVNPRNRFSRRYKRIDADDRDPGPVDWVSGTFMMVRRSVFDALGGFDEGYFMYVEDVDLCWRCWASGRRVGYEPAARVVHAIGASSELTPYRMILAHHRSLWRFSVLTLSGPKRLLLPLIGPALALRVMLAWAQRAFRNRPHAAP